MRISRRVGIRGFLQPGVITYRNQRSAGGGTPVIPPSGLPPVLWWDYAGNGTLPDDHTFLRDSTATYVGADGLVKTAEVDEPRFEYDADGNALGLLIEPAGENLLLNSEAVQTQGVTLAATEHTLSLTGTGSITLSGAATGTLAGTGADERVFLTFTPSAGAVTFTVTGECKYGQVEEGSAGTSWIVTHADPKTRAADICTAEIPAGTFTGPGSFLANYNSKVGGNAAIYAAALGATERLSYTSSTGAERAFDGSSIVPYGSLESNADRKTALAVSDTLVAKGAADGTLTISVSDFLVFSQSPTFMSVGTSISGASPVNGHMKRIQLWDVGLDDADLVAITEPDTPPLVNQTSGYVIASPQSPNDSQFIDPDGPGADALEINGAVPSYFGSAGKTTLILDIDDQGGDILVQFGSLKRPIRMAFDTTKGGPYIYKGDDVRDVLAAVRGKVVPIKYLVIGE